MSWIRRPSTPTVVKLEAVGLVSGGSSRRRTPLAAPCTLVAPKSAVGSSVNSVGPPLSVKPWAPLVVQRDREGARRWRRRAAERDRDVGVDRHVVGAVGRIARRRSAGGGAVARVRRADGEVGHVVVRVRRRCRRSRAVVLRQRRGRRGLEVVGACRSRRSRARRRRCRSRPRRSAPSSLVTSATLPLAAAMAIDAGGVRGRQVRGAAGARGLLHEVVAARRGSCRSAASTCTRSRRSPRRTARSSRSRRRRPVPRLQQLDEVVRVRRSGVAAAAVDLADDDVRRCGAEAGAASTRARPASAARQYAHGGNYPAARPRL